MIRDRGRWSFDGDYTSDYSKSYPAIRESLRILLENLISSKVLLPRALDRNNPLDYNTVDELLNRIEESGYLENTSEFNIVGDTVIYTSHGEEVHQRIVRIVGFRTTAPFFVFVVSTDHWLPMMMDSETMDFSWNLELYQRNYHRIPALLKKLNEQLDWENEDLLSVDDGFLSTQAGCDFFLEESVITSEYKANPNPAFDLDAYLDAIKQAKEQYSR